MDLDRKTIEKDETYLRQTSVEVDFEKDNIKEIIARLKDYCAQHCCFALAPVQIGIPKRIIYIKNTSQNMENNVTEGYDESIIYINPTIIAAKGYTTFLEGCMSCVYHQDGEIIYYAGIVNRPYKIEVTFYDVQGNKKTKYLEDFEATVFCHEYDHLNGILHMDISKQIFEMTLEEMRLYRLSHPYEVVSKDAVYKNKVKRNKDIVC